MNSSTQSSNGGSPLLSVRETAQRLGIARRTLEREVSRRKFPPPLKIGSKSLYAESDVEAYIAKLKEQRAAIS
jgi:excisionase family DNA binding protein